MKRRGRYINRPLRLCLKEARSRSPSLFLTSHLSTCWQSRITIDRSKFILPPHMNDWFLWYHLDTEVIVFSFVRSLWFVDRLTICFEEVTAHFDRWMISCVDRPIEENSKFLSALDYAETINIIWLIFEVCRFGCHLSNFSLQWLRWWCAYTSTCRPNKTSKCSYTQGTDWDNCIEERTVVSSESTSCWLSSHCSKANGCVDQVEWNLPGRS